MIRIPALFLGIVCYANVTVAQTPARYDIVINEIMADPSPQAGLPNNEWIELYNRSGTAISITGWRIADAGSQSGPVPVYTLQPGSYVIVCAAGSAAAMSSYGPVITVTGFPSLDNTGDIVSLKSAQNNIIHSVNYTDNWYRNELKKEGGWTLEMTDSNNPCSGYSNWAASTDSRGGTPGTKNATAAVNSDNTAPRLLRAFATDSLNITLVFDEPLDSTLAVNANTYSISDGIGIPKVVSAVAPSFDKVILQPGNALLRKKVYTITVNAAADCAGNLSGSQAARVGLGELAGSMDIIVNELLFNPKPNGSDYIELYNRSNHIIDLKQLYIANRNSAGVISNIKQVSTENYLLFPQDFMVVTEDAAAVKKGFIAKNPDAFISIASMPSFNDDEGYAIILNAQGVVTDELHYSEKWHFSLITNTEGIALERIDYNAVTQQQDNWHSAAASVGYGTPSYKNSQYKTNDALNAAISITPEIISPDNDGRDDFATVSYRFPAPGYVANITVFDAAGRPVRYLQRNALCGITGNFTWDGLGEKNQRLPAGIYIFYTSIFNTSGKKKEFKNTIVVAGK